MTQPHQSGNSSSGADLPDTSFLSDSMPSSQPIDPQTNLQTQKLKLPIPPQLAPLVQDLCHLYARGNSNMVVEALSTLVSSLKHHIEITNTDHKLIDLLEEGEYDDAYVSFLRSWHDILGMEVYIDTDIYDTVEIELPHDAPPLPDTIVKHQEASEAYLKSWAEVAEQLVGIPDDLFSRSWGTTEVAKFLNCSVKTLRKAKNSGKLPLQVGDFIVDVDSATEKAATTQKGKKILWRIRPA